MRTAGDLLGDVAFQRGERVGEQRFAPVARVDGDPGELVAGGGPLGKAHRLLGLILAEDVDGKPARGRDRVCGRRRLVQADQHHRRLERQRADGARGRASAFTVVRRGDHRHAAGEVSDHIAELLGREPAQGRFRARVGLCRTVDSLLGCSDARAHVLLLSVDCDSGSNEL